MGRSVFGCMRRGSILPKPISERASMPSSNPLPLYPPGLMARELWTRWARVQALNPVIGFCDGSYGATQNTGTYAEKVVCDAEAVHLLPDVVTLEQGAAVGFPGMAAYRALFQCAGLSPQNASSYTARAEVWGPSPYSWRVHVERS